MNTIGENVSSPGVARLSAWPQTWRRAFEIDDEYIKIAQKRINDYLNNNLKIRPLGKPVYKPTGREKVAQIPLSWVPDAA